ncbi:GumC family protein [Rhizobium halophytocola]|uniref:Uncharacterized protein involved in exopolysaccharide biosynthesis n=1 Tax=Rhizobium halophytocola TaxID=735519 RepID=A0ABS4E280_9HYPH|nr:GumC family protein [Rhizobium halophytocola]MBP1852031.1 uncharacterized protein involved in exopolysaccharide biosynthesis [Rhizobium halophytocola]
MNIDIFELPGILRRRIRYVVVTALVVTILAALVALRMTPVYTASTELLLDPLGLLADSNAGSAAAALPQQDQAGLDSQVYVVQSRNVLDQVVRDLDLTHDAYLLDPDTLAKLSTDEAVAATSAALKEHLVVQRAGQSLVLVISAEHKVAETAASIANAVANTYLKQIDQARADAARRASNAFQGQASELRGRVAKAEAAVEKFRSENGLATTGTTGLVIDQQLAGLNQQLIAARGEEEQKQTVYEQARRLTANSVQAGGIPEALQSPAIDSLRQRYVELLDRQVQLETTLGAGHPQLRAIRSQVDSMKAAIEQELGRIRQSMQSEYQRAAANTKALQRRLDTLTRQSFDSGEAQIKLRQLQSEADAVQALYKSFLNRAEELGQQETLKTNNSRVITAATVPGGGSKLVKLLIVAAGGLFGLILGAGLAVLRELGTAILPPARPVVAAAVERRVEKDAEIDVIAVLPVPGESAKRKRALLGARKRQTDAKQRWATGIEAIAAKIERDLGGRMPATVLFVSVDALPVSADGLVCDVVRRLIAEGQDVRHAPGELVEQRSRAARAPIRRGQPSMLAALDVEDEDTGILDRLRFEHDAAAAPPRPQATNRPSFNRFLGTQIAEKALTLINACGTPATKILGDLIPESDMVIVVEQAGSTDWADAEYLFGDRMLGRVILGETD